MARETDMKAYVLHGINDIRYEDVSKPYPGRGEVLVRIHAAGICGSDIPRIYTTGTYSYPLIPGHEFAGEVMEIGTDADKGWLGKRVGIFPLIPCMECTSCRKSQFEMCRHYNYLGSRTNGGFAEYAAVPEWNLIELPQKVSYEQAAMLEPMAVAVHAMRRVFRDRIDSGRTVAVYGLGTIGMLLTMFLLEAGLKNILVIGNKDFQKEMICRLGIDGINFCDSRKQEVYSWVMEHTQGAGAEVFFECVGRNETVRDAICGTAPGGSVQMIGNPASDMTFDRNTYWVLLRNQLNVLGSWNSSYTHDMRDDWHYVLDRLQGGRIQPEQFITQKITMEELERGFLLMRDKTEEYVKVMGASE